MIEIGEYVRTKKGIGKILDIKTCQDKMYGKYNVVYLIDICLRMYISETIFIKHSKNIIDLIEKYDFVNERLVIDIDRKNNKICLLEPFDDKNLSNSFIVWHDIEDIKSIVTKEQFESMKYEVE